jgi:EAL domain-containing protein (putative c-di-GMP-specific phosphodiesterase class I)
LGISLAIDDFGTGYASISQLAMFPFDKIKIDKSLAGTDPRELALVKAITQLGVDLGLSTLAEGVESSEQMAQLHGDGRDYLQGYHLGRPMTAQNAALLIERMKQ